tara:strand:+ start:266 stop:895 length:630 start_codon:yes stop_codon:yes gene_type:complete
MNYDSFFDHIWLVFPRTQTELHGILSNTLGLHMVADTSGKYQFVVKQTSHVRRILAGVNGRKVQFTRLGQWLFSWFCVYEDMDAEIRRCKDSLQFSGSMSELHQQLAGHGLLVEQIEGSDGVLRVIRRGRFGGGDPRQVFGIIFWKTIFLVHGGRGIFIMLSADSEHFVILTASDALVPVGEADEDKVRTVLLGENRSSVFFRTHLLRV